MIRVLNLLTIVVTIGSSYGLRIVEQPITFPSDIIKGVPIVDPPKRSAGYFKLDRTEVRRKEPLCPCGALVPDE